MSTASIFNDKQTICTCGFYCLMVCCKLGESAEMIFVQNCVLSFFSVHPVSPNGPNCFLAMYINQCTIGHGTLTIYGMMVILS